MFKAKVIGTPAPTVTWSRANGEIVFHPDVCVQKYDPASQEYTIEVSYTQSIKCTVNKPVINNYIWMSHFQCVLYIQ